ncbi:hypothetical protein [Nonomuraea sp. LPB2021202275-12-8]|uniref:hypothetical protein n=1 Tax=Nonomuraea sp. LPB2021202275-12-8 TaxID=3120159 RepID=UPI00300C929D
MDALIRGIIGTAAAILPEKAQRERYLEQWLADAEGAAELETSSLSVAFGALRAAVVMNLTRRSAVALGLAAVLVIGGIRLTMITSDWVPGAAMAMAGVALPILLLIIRRFRDRDTLGDWEDALAARQARLSKRAFPDADLDRKRLFALVLGAVLVALAALLLLTSRSDDHGGALDHVSVSESASIQGGRDILQPAADTRAFAARLAAAGVRHEPVEIPYADHQFDLSWGGFASQIARHVIEEFLREIR